MQNAWRRCADVPAQTPASVRMSKDLIARGFRFVGPTICYAFMQATGMVNDHSVDCFRHAEVAAKSREPRQGRKSTARGVSPGGGTRKPRQGRKTNARGVSPG